MRSPESLTPRSWAQLCISVIFSLAGFAVVLFGVGDQSSAKLAGGWLGAVLGFWLR
jgi:hypothetical protein